jgi:hypothetical protein
MSQLKPWEDMPVDNKIQSAANALFVAVKYMLGRIGRDPNVQYYCGSCTEALRLLSAAYALATDGNAEEIARNVASSCCGEHDAARLRRLLDSMDCED